MVKRVGDRIQRGDVLAETKAFITWFKTQVRAPITGTVETISTATGQVILREPPRPVELFAYLDGTVAEVLPGQGARVETTCAVIQGIFGIGGETWGSLVLGVASPEEDVTAAHFTSAHTGKIVVGGAFVGAEALARAKAVGVKGIVVGGMHDKDLRALLGYDLGVAITGTETVGFTVVLTEGFGRIPMARRTFELLRKLDGRKASISGATQIRAGVIRPEIIVPLAPGEQIPGIETGQRGEVRGGVKVGDPVRVIRAPFFGRIGEVVGLPSDLQMIPTESRVRERGRPDDAHRVADLDSAPYLSPLAGFDARNLFAGRQRHDDFRTDDPRADLRRAGDGRLASVQLPQQLEGPPGHRDAPEPFGQDQGKADGFRSGDGYAKVVTQERPQVLVMHPADDDPLDANGFGPREGLGSDKGAAHHDLARMGGREVSSRHILLRRSDPQDQAPPGFTADPEDPLDEGARGLHTRALARQHLRHRAVEICEELHGPRRLPQDDLPRCRRNGLHGPGDEIGRASC